MYYGQERLGKYFSLSVDRSFSLEQSQRTSLWNFIYILRNEMNPSVISMQTMDTLLSDAIRTLQEWPTEQIRWPYYNTGI